MKKASWFLMVFILFLGVAMKIQQINADDDQENTEGIYVEDFSSYAYNSNAWKINWDAFSGNLQLQPMNAIAQVWSDVVYDGSGHAYIAWMDYRYGKADIFMQRIDNDGNRLWASDLRVNSDVGQTWQGHPALAMEPDGSVIVAWADERSGQADRRDVYAQRINANGNKIWGSDVKVNVTNGDINSHSVDIATDIFGNVFVSWARTINSSTLLRDINLQRLDNSGSRLWTADFLVAQDAYNDGSRYAFTALATDSIGNAVVGWEDGSIHVHKISYNKYPLWSNAVPIIINDVERGGIGWHPTISVNSSGEIFVAWRKALYWDIYVHKLSSSGQALWANPVEVASQGHTQPGQRVQLALDSDGKAVIVWDGYEGYEHARGAWMQAVTAGGSLFWSSPKQIAWNNSPYPSITTGTTGQVLVVHNGIEYSRMGVTNSSGASYYASRHISESSGTEHQREATIEHTPDNNLVVGWRNFADDNINHSFFLQSINNSGVSLWSNPIRIPTQLYDGQLFLWDELPPVQTAVTQDGYIYAAWSADGDPYIQKLDQNGNVLWASNLLIDKDGFVLENIAAMPDGGVVVAYQKSKYENNEWVYATYLQRVNANGQLLWGDGIRLGDHEMPKEVGLVVASDGSIFVASEAGGEYTNPVYVWRINSSGNIIWQTTRSFGTNPVSIDLDNSENLIITWLSGTSIYAQKLISSGSEVWPTDRLVDTGSIGENGLPKLATDSNGYAVIVWADNADHLVYAQRINSSGFNTWGSKTRISAGNLSQILQYDPTVSVDNSGKAYIAWVDERNSNEDIYLQGLTTGGGRLWTSDRQVRYPDFSYNNWGYAFSKEIDSTSDNIREATLTSEYALNSGAVAFKLTNNGGQDWFSVTPGVTHVFTTTGSSLRWMIDLRADALWPRTPVINSLRIEYSTAISNGDSFEPDDSCNQAQPIQLNGAAQQHSFHQYEDSDWIWFDAQSGTTYTVQTGNTGLNADTVLELYGQCGQPPDVSEDNAFGPGVTLTFSAPTTGRYYIRILQNDGSIYGEGTEYDLSVRAQVPTGAAIIVAGRLKTNDTVQPIIEATADLAYQSLLQGGLSPDNILYLSTATGRTGVDGLPTEANIRDAIQDWARTRVGLGAPLWLYLADHGNIDRVHNEIGEAITAAELNLWLSNLEATSGVDQLNIVIDTCYSGSFIDTYQAGGWGSGEISGQGRIIVSSTSSRWFAYAPPIVTGQPIPLMYFSDGFWNAIGEGQSIWSAFLAGRKTVEAGGQRCGDYDYSCQRPWLDDTGDAWFDGTDGLVAQTQGLSASFGGSGAPYIDWLTVDDVSGGQATIRVQVRDDSRVERVWARIFAPSFTPPETTDGSIPEIEVPELELVWQSGDVFAIDYAGFTETGAYQVVVYAQDDEANVAAPRWVLTGEQNVYLPLIVK